ncbi:hypothetical protein SLEP1_g47297 [Rubroshorea leprosula]|uniref:Uncharacterized protein n=1 Tax=Rubroshorea leprosula TaxID=152421 RepID=A0AAV5LQX9_9ROSI|nr:hypothetical protein SLEP1_g47297 [Rubroshorea leprosula]
MDHCNPSIGPWKMAHKSHPIIDDPVGTSKQFKKFRKRDKIRNYMQLNLSPVSIVINIGSMLA